MAPPADDTFKLMQRGIITRDSLDVGLNENVEDSCCVNDDTVTKGLPQNRSTVIQRPQNTNANHSAY